MSTPGAKMEVDEENDPELDAGQGSRYRRLVARGKVVAIDRKDMKFAIKDLARDMAEPKVSSWQALIRLAKYLNCIPRFAIWYK